MEIRRIQAHEGARLRAIRLSALADAPAAFGSTLAETEARPFADWEQRACDVATAESSTAMFIAEEDGVWYGLAGGFLVVEEPGTAQLFSMWVHPGKRRSGLGAALVETVAGWARGRGAVRLQLEVTSTNAPARSLYARLGFVDTGRTHPHPSQPGLVESLMVRDLGSTAAG